ncbi:VOC family protein [Micromonospora sp. NBC_01739]|uniref:VOC family protein n=1 Tax=Micromonospora sp. NBC_01739 TaxID=2975985 RepID=UPI002E141706|nr:VOC family protein [Micromonospora sp. NBC_01739]
MGNVAALRGLSTVTYWADDVPAARAWYSELLGGEPYFERGGAYLEWRIGDYEHELGIIDRAWAPPGAAAVPGGAVVYWHVDDIEAMFDRLLAMGAVEYEPITKREAGFVTAAVTDPFGNVLGIMFSPHYLDRLESLTNSLPASQ